MSRTNPSSDPQAPVTEAGDSRTRTSRAVANLVDCVQSDLSDVEKLILQVLGLITRMERDARIINGLSPSCRGWRLQLEQMLEDVREERTAIPRHVYGGGPGIFASVDDGMVDQVREAREHKRWVRVPPTPVAELPRPAAVSPPG